jgi:hypothetical protein
MSNNITDTFNKLIGKTIISIDVLSINCVMLHTSDNQHFEIETVYALPGIFGMEVLDSDGKIPEVDVDPDYYCE